jgi:hypothetical protein
MIEEVRREGDRALVITLCRQAGAAGIGVPELLLDKGEIGPRLGVVEPDEGLSFGDRVAIADKDRADDAAFEMLPRGRLRICSTYRHRATPRLYTTLP